MLIKEALETLGAKIDLSAEDSKNLFDQIFKGDISENDIRQLLIGFAKKGETPAEILGAARSMRANMIPYQTAIEAIDVVGTGGDKLGTLNISTAAAILTAACGVPVAKHGNRASSSLSGSSDVLAALGVNLEPSCEILRRCLPELGIVFLFAPHHHPAMRFVAPVRRELRMRTIFNFLGPLTNPANVKRHLIGVSSKELLRPMAEVLQKLGSTKAWLANSFDGMDEITTTGKTHIVEMTPSTLLEKEMDPTSLGLPKVPLGELEGGNAMHNAEAMKNLFQGKEDAYRDVVLLNCAAALVVAEKTATLQEGLALATKTIDNGSALQKLAHLVKFTQKAS